MRAGMLWFDNSQQRDLESKIRRATAYYQTKYGALPNTCYVHPGMVVTAGMVIEGICIKTSNMILPHHYWLGDEDELEQRPAA